MAYVKSPLKPPVSFPTVSGAIASFNSQYAGLPLKSHEVAITAVQAGSGTPSPSNPRSISGWDSITVVGCGKNIFPSDVSYTENYYLKSDGTIPYSNAWNLSDYIAIPKVENLSIDYVNFPTSAGGVVYGFFDKNKTFISGINATNHVIPIPSNTYYMRLSIRKDAENIQLEIGSTSTPYEAFNGQTETRSFGQTVYGGVLDCKSGVVTVTNVLKDLGDLTWGSATNEGRFQSSVISDISPITSSATVANIYCSHYKSDTARHWYSVTEDNIIAECGGGYGGDKTIGIVDSTLANKTASDVKTAMNGVMLAHELATPITIQLTPIQLETLLAENNIWCDTGDTSLQYIKLG